MKQVILKFSLLITILLVASCSNDDDSIHGSGTIITEERTVPTFSKIDAVGDFNISIVYGDQQGIEISADNNIINRVKIAVTNSRLTVNLANGNYSNITVTVTISIPTFSEITNSGSGTINASGFFNQDSIIIINTGSGSFQLSGSGTSLSINNSGSGSFNGFEYISDNCVVNNSGSGSSEIYCANTLSGTNSGDGNILYKGTPQITVTNSGSGQIINAN